jgi:hypothetical protein
VESKEKREIHQLGKNNSVTNLFERKIRNLRRNMIK